MVEINELPWTAREAGFVAAVVEPDGPGYWVESSVYRGVHCPTWADLCSTLRTQAASLPLPLRAVYYPNESAQSARIVEFA